MTLGKPLVVKGRFEEATIFEALHIIGWLKKTGCLRVEAPPVRGVVLIRNGLVVGAYSESNINRILAFARGLVRGDKNEFIKQQILVALNEFADLAEGEFYFFQESVLKAPELGSVNLSDVVLEHGLNPNQLVLILAHQRDEKHQTTFPGEILGPEPGVAVPGHHPVFTELRPGQLARDQTPTTAVLLVDDEAPVREVVGSELRMAGHEVHTASGPAEALALTAGLVRAARRELVVVVDLEMPTTSGQSYFGGFELVRNLVDSKIDVPVFLMAEKLSDSARDRAKRLGVRKVAFKPSLSKLDTEQYQRDLRSFALLLLNLLKEMGPRLDQARNFEVGTIRDPLTRHFLSSMGEQLADPERSLRMSEYVLPVAASIASAKDDKKTRAQAETALSVWDRSNLRKHERIELLRIKATFRRGNDVGSGYLTDLSEKGAFLRTNDLFPVGEIIRLRIFLPYQLGEISTEARIIWLNYSSRNHTAAPHGMGLAFLGPFS